MRYLREVMDGLNFYFHQADCMGGLRSSAYTAEVARGQEGAKFTYPARTDSPDAYTKIAQYQAILPQITAARKIRAGLLRLPKDQRDIILAAFYESPSKFDWRVRERSVIRPLPGYAVDGSLLICLIAGLRTPQDALSACTRGSWSGEKRRAREALLGALKALHLEIQNDGN